MSIAGKFHCWRIHRIVRPQHRRVQIARLCVLDVISRTQGGRRGLRVRIRGNCHDVEVGVRQSIHPGTVHLSHRRQHGVLRRTVPELDDHRSGPVEPLRGRSVRLSGHRARAQRLPARLACGALIAQPAIHALEAGILHDEPGGSPLPGDLAASGRHHQAEADDGEGGARRGESDGHTMGADPAGWLLHVTACRQSLPTVHFSAQHAPGTSGYFFS